MKECILKPLLLFMIIFIPNPSHARQFLASQSFNPGEILSSDVLNDVLENINNNRKELMEDDILGDWICTSYATSFYTPVVGWEADESGLRYTLSNVTIEFSKNGETYYLSTSAPSPFFHVSEDSVNTRYVLENNLLYFQPEEDTGIAIYELKRLSDSRIMLYSAPVSSSAQDTLICDLLNLPPINPKQLTATLSNTTVSLTWQDDSDDEASFSIRRKDSLTGEYAEIGTASENATTYTDTLTTEGKYWYRVMAVNENGDSVGSNVVKVTYGDDTESLKNELRMLRDRMELLETEMGGM